MGKGTKSVVHALASEVEFGSGAMPEPTHEASFATRCVQRLFRDPELASGVLVTGGCDPFVFWRKRGDLFEKSERLRRLFCGV